MNLQNNYGFDENAVVVLKKRYCLKDEHGNLVEDIVDVFRRSARCAASVEVPELIQVYEDKFFNVMIERKFMPNSPMLSGAGTDFNLMACFVLPIDDNMESIFNGVKDTAFIHKSGGGTGFTFSKLRPEGDMVKTTSGVASGPISFMRIIDVTTETVKQGGKRRGANMGILSISHPDIVKFIDIKSKEGILSNFNLSVSITDEFMELVIKGVDFEWPLCFNDRVYKKISGQYLWSLIITGAWKLGEPGTIFIDTINRYNPAKDFQTIEATNPCVTGDTLVAVADGRGFVSIRALSEEGKDVPVYCVDTKTGITHIRMGRNPRKTRKDCEIVKIILDDNSYIRTSKDHRFITRSKSEIKATDLQCKLSLLPFNKWQSFNKNRLYWHIGSGGGFTGMREHKMIYEFYHGTQEEGGIYHHTDGVSLNNSVENIEYLSISEHGKVDFNINYVKGENNPMWDNHHSEETKQVIGRKTTERFEDVDFKNKFILRMKEVMGDESIRKKISIAKTKEKETFVFECEICHEEFTEEYIKGSQPPNRRVCGHKCAAALAHMNYDGPTEECKQKISETAKIIWNTEAGKQSRREAGIFSTKSKAMKCGNTLFNLDSDIDQNNWNSFQKLAYANGIGHFIKSDTILKYWDSWESFEDDCLNYNHKIVEIIDDGNEDVYNITVDDFHTIAYITNTAAISKGKLPKLTGIFTFQCGESPLGPYEACCLGSINLSQFVTTIGTSTHQIVNIEWEQLKDTVEIGVRFLDNIINKNKYPIVQIEKQSNKFRKIGLGVMGWADMLLKLKISYNSLQALELAEKVMKFISETAHRYSEELRIEKGPMGLFEGIESDHPLNKRRNSTLTIIAPTGTISIVGGCSSSIEPVFSFEFKKKCLDGEMIVKHPLYEQWEKEVNYQLPYDRPNYFVESKDVPIEQHVKMQAAFQKYTDGAVSKTINAPNSATIEDVDRAFQLAYKLGCKGLTFYRDGSREFQAQTATKPEPPKGQSILGTVLDDFANFRKSDDPEDHKTDAIKYLTTGLNPVVPDNNSAGPDTETPTWLPGWREKVKTGSGTLWVHVFEDPITGFREVWTAVSKPGRDMAAAADSTGRLISLALRHGASWDSVVKQLQGHIGEKTVWDNGVQIMSIQDGTAKVLRKRCVDQTLPEFNCPFSIKCQQVGNPATEADFKLDAKLIVKAINQKIEPKNYDLCPECASTLIHDEGCKGGRCNSCGWSNCS